MKTFSIILATLFCVSTTVFGIRNITRCPRYGCHNGGTCLEQGDQLCKCQKDYSGLLCEVYDYDHFGNFVRKTKEVLRGSNSCSCCNSCFALSNYVKMADGSERSISLIKPGDYVKSIDEHGHLFDTEIVAILRNEKTAARHFFDIQTEDGHLISLTPDHLIFEKSKGFIKANRIEIDDVLQVKTFNSTQFSKVSDIQVKVDYGFIAPLTDSGTLLVNGIYSSCYTINSHWLAHFAMKPLIYWYKLKKSLGYNTNDMINDNRHVYLSFLKQTGLKSFADIIFM